MPLVFSTSSVDTLWVYSCSYLGCFFFWGLSGSKSSFLWSSIRVYLLLVEIYSFRLPVCRIWKRISKTRIRVYHQGLEFSSFIFFECSFEWIEKYFHFRIFFATLSTLFIHSTFFMITPFPYFAPKSLYLPRICFLVCLHPFSPPLSGNFLLLFGNIRFFLFCLALSRYLFRLFSLAITFWFISSSSIFCSNRLTFLCSCQNILMFFLCLSIFVCCCSFITCVSNRISPSRFWLSVVMFRETLIFLQTNFAPA